MKKLVKIVMVIGFGLLVGCNATKELKIPQGEVIKMKIKH